MLSKQQKREFVEAGYLVIPGAVPQVMIAEARRAVNHSIGYVGIGGEDLENHRSGFHCHELLGAAAYLDIWKEWDGVREVVAGEAVSRYNQ